MIYTVRQVAERFQVKPHTVLAWIGSGELKATNVARKPDGLPRWRIRESQVAAFEALRSGEPAPNRGGNRRTTSDDYIRFY